VNFNVLYPSTYSSIPNEMICYTGNNMLIPGNFKVYIKDKQNILDIINEKKELFVVTLNEVFPKHVGMGLWMPFCSYHLWYLIDRFGFVIDDVTEMSLFYSNLFAKFTIQLRKKG
jgi:hypothetical protein